MVKFEGFDKDGNFIKREVKRHIYSELPMKENHRDLGIVGMYEPIIIYKADTEGLTEYLEEMVYQRARELGGEVEIAHLPSPDKSSLIQVCFVSSKVNLEESAEKTDVEVTAKYPDTRHWYDSQAGVLHVFEYDPYTWAICGSFHYEDGDYTYIFLPKKWSKIVEKPSHIVDVRRLLYNPFVVRTEENMKNYNRYTDYPE